MKTHLSLLVCLSLLALCLPAPAAADSVVGVGAFWHVEHTVFKDLPYDDGDISYNAFLQLHDANGYLEALVEYAPEVGGLPATDYTITPRISIFFKDQAWRAGIGVLSSYITEDAGDSDWTDIYWHLSLGLSVPVSALEVTILTQYVYEDWGEISEFDFEDLEFSVGLGYRL